VVRQPVVGRGSGSQIGLGGGAVEVFMQAAASAVLSLLAAQLADGHLEQP